MDVTIKDIPREIDFRWHTDPERFTILTEFSCLVSWKRGLLGGGTTKRYTVPVGFDTDLASIPRFLLSTIGGKVHKHIIAAVLHDHLYRTGYASKDLADEIFLTAMKELGVSWKRRYTMYWAVRLGGKSSYMAKPVLTAP